MLRNGKLEEDWKDGESSEIVPKQTSLASVLLMEAHYDSDPDPSSADHRVSSTYTH